mgnify:CR=1 FL=1
MAKKHTKKQTEIPGTERKGVPEIEAAADELREARAELKAATKARDAKAAALIAAMREHQVTKYVFEDGDDETVVDLEQLDKVKVRTRSKAPPAQGATAGAN